MEPVARQVTLPAGVEEVWSLLTHPDELRAWLGRDVELEASPGARGRVVDHDGTIRSLEVDDVEPGRRLAWRWWPEDGGPMAASRVEITIAPTADGTEVRVVEWPSASASASPVASASAGEAWSHRLLHLEALLLVAAAVRG